MVISGYLHPPFFPLSPTLPSSPSSLCFHRFRFLSFWAKVRKEICKADIYRSRVLYAYSSKWLFYPLQIMIRQPVNGFFFVSFCPLLEIVSLAKKIGKTFSLPEMENSTQNSPSPNCTASSPARRPIVGGGRLPSKVYFPTSFAFNCLFPNLLENNTGKQIFRSLTSSFFFYVLPY